MKHRLTTAAILAATLLLSACDSAEERAEAHYEAGIAFLEEGDDQRASLEFRNALQLVPDHRGAGIAFAELLADQDRFDRAASYYLRMVEYDPDFAEGRVRLAELALDSGDIATARRSVDKAIELGAASPRTEAVAASLAYRDALQSSDRIGRDAAAGQARRLVEEEPGLVHARRIAVFDAVQREAWNEVIALADAGIANAPEKYEFYDIRLRALEQVGRNPEVTALLEDMVERFPEEEALPQTLAQWYVLEGDIASAKALLRVEAAEAPEDLETQRTLVSFLREHQGDAAAEAELERLAGQGDANNLSYRAMLATLKYQTERQAEAIADMRTLLDEAAALPKEEQKPQDVASIRVDLARMLLEQGESDAARELVEAALRDDPTRTEALKMRATWFIDEDRVEDAIVDLRTAMRESPQDPAIMTLMAAAHERAGETDLKREMLAKAVELSGSAPAETLRYAGMLIADGRYNPAEEVLMDALRLHREDVALYSELGRLMVLREDWGRAEQVATKLEELAAVGQDPAAAPAMNTLRAQILSAQDREEDLFAFLDGLSRAEDAGIAADIAIIRGLVDQGDLEGARARLTEAQEKAPDLPILRLLDVAVTSAEGDHAAAAAALDGMLAEAPQSETLWLARMRLELLQGDREAAAEVLDRGLEAVPEGANLLFTKAGQLEAEGDIDGAIAIYETLYARNSNAAFVANNLASLLSMYRDDPETLQRAYRISRRLQDAEAPPLRDTYGWIAARLGRFEEAERHLAFAAEGMPRHPVVQFHYAFVLAQLGRESEALERFRAVEALDTSLLSEADRETLASEIARIEAGEPLAPSPQ
ncbi:tetratricopeptide repeat protein [Tropicimonas sediminicola]|uniref:tetratricopeptide repeat protein n=1 Tax=Tropicimonas sediminicola TaxID=1031541 RepID=UPI001595ED49|nr:tetratricopeptide repeat protein [Tropicimonas sediminicola]